ncbi:MAG: squalene/phytoene synthase family protein [Phycisphaerae bacterium]|nr:squalene/phytoene synthase family protein [Phycisphaerae bacterium]
MTTPIEQCHRILPGVSRTFALLIPELPAELRAQVCCAYLLCRVADTVEDYIAAPTETRLEAFDAFCEAFEVVARTTDLRLFGALTGDWSLDEDHRRLLNELGTVFAAFDTFPESDREIITDCVREMVEGMRQAVARPANAEPAGLPDVTALERYCYYVAGVVGRMLTRLYWRHVYGDAPGPSDELIRKGIDFGLGLQLTNVLKDQRADMGRGVSYMPNALATMLNVDADAIRAGTLPRPMREWLVGRALTWLDTAFEYTLAWPPTATGIRIFCLGALLMAVRTLAVVLSAPEDLDATEAPKITRQDVDEIMTRVRANAGNDAELHQWYTQERERLAGLLPGTTPG